MKTFLHKKSDGTYVYLFYDSKTGSLAMRQYGKKGWKSHIIILRSNVERTFSAVSDKNGHIHIAFSKINGGIHYGRLSDKPFNSFQILSSKSKMNYKKHLMIAAGENPICIFYTVQHSGKTIISMQTINPTKNTASSPIAIDYLADIDLNINFCENCDGNILLAYSKELEDGQITNIIREINRYGETVKTNE